MISVKNRALKAEKRNEGSEYLCLFVFICGLGNWIASSIPDLLAMTEALVILVYLVVQKIKKTPYPDTPLFEGIKRFQRDNGLTVDGIMKPDGETERAMNRTLDGWNKKWWDSDAVKEVEKEIEKNADLKNDGPPLTTQQRKKVILEDKAAIFKVIVI